MAEHHGVVAGTRPQLLPGHEVMRGDMRETTSKENEMFAQVTRNLARANEIMREILDNLEKAARETPLPDPDLLTPMEVWADTAVALGWENVSDNGQGVLIGLPPKGTESRKSVDTLGYRARVPNYIEDLEAASEIDNEVRRRGIEMKYADALLGSMPTGSFPSVLSGAMVLLHATPLQRCRAFLKALREAKK